MFTLVICCLTTSNLPWFMHLTLQVPMQYCSLQHRTLLLSAVPSTTGCCFALAPSLHSFWSYFSTDSSSILGTYRLGEFIFQYPIFLPFHTVHGVLKARILKWLAIPFSSGPHSVRLVPSRKKSTSRLYIVIYILYIYIYIVVYCLFNLYAEYLYAEYIMRNTGLEEAQARIKIAGKTINNFRYADDTTLMAKSEEELKSLWWKWKKRVKKLA